MAFTLGAYSLAGDPLGPLEFSNLRLRRPLSAGQSLEFRSWLDVVGQRLEASTTQVRFFEDGVPLFGGVISPPLERAPEGLRVNALGPLAAMKRQRQTVYAPAGAPRLDLIVDELLTQENARSPTHLRIGQLAGTFSTLTSYQLLPGVEVPESLVALATSEPGFYFLEYPDFAPAGNWGRLDMRAPDVGSGDDLQAQVRFEYGRGTRDNLASYLLSESAIVNAVTVRGAATDPALPAPVIRIQDDASIALYGLREVHTELVDVVSDQFMTAMAQSQMKPEPVETLSFTPLTGADVPRVLRDFEVGDTVGVVIRDGPVNVEAAARIVEAQLIVSDDSSEAAQELVAESALEEA